MRNVRLILVFASVTVFAVLPQAKGHSPNPARGPASTVARRGQTDTRVAAPPKPLPILPSKRYRLADDAFAGEVCLAPLNQDALLAEGNTYAKTHGRRRTGIRRDLQSTADDGQWHAVSGAGNLWTLRMVSPGARSLRVHFSGVDLPSGAQLYLWSPEAAGGMDGPFTGQGPRGDGRFWSTILAGESVSVEYFAPGTGDGAPELPFKIDGVMHVYRDFVAAPDEELREGDCHNDSSCFANWAEVRNAVARVSFIDGDVGYTCTGQLLATEAGDFTPYFLTANHCCDNQAIADTFVAHWFYQSGNCDGPVPPLSSLPTSSMADLAESSNLADYALLLIRGELPTGLYWSGWTSGPIDTGQWSTSIHHPDGAFKRISLGVRGLSVDEYWRIDWYDGPTEPGSDGAGIWRDDTQQLYGHLSGGPCGCGQETYADYGKFSEVYPAIASFLRAGSDDDLEDNDSAAQAIAIPAGVWSYRVVKINDEDWYAITVPSCAALEIGVFFIDAHGDIDIELFDEATGELVASSRGGGNGEAISIPVADILREFVLRVYLASDTRNTYQLGVAFTDVGSNSRLTLREAVSGLPAPIPDGNPDGVSRSMAIPEPGTILDLDLDLRIHHTWNGDLVVKLTHRDTTATLVERPGSESAPYGFDDAGFDITLDDTAGVCVETFDGDGAMVTGVLSPYPDALSVFAGMDQAGTWTINVSDHVTHDTGALLGWTLRLITQASDACRRNDAAADACRIIDDRIDLIDVAYFQNCLTGQEATGLGSCCGVFDYDPKDDDVDLADFAILQASINGPVQ